MGGIGFARGFFKKNHRMVWDTLPPILLRPTMGNPAPYSIKKPDRLPLHLCYVININNMII